MYVPTVKVIWWKWSPCSESRYRGGDRTDKNEIYCVMSFINYSFIVLLLCYNTTFYIVKSISVGIRNILYLFLVLWLHYHATTNFRVISMCMANQMGLQFRFLLIFTCWDLLFCATCFLLWQHYSPIMRIR